MQTILPLKPLFCIGKQNYKPVKNVLLLCSLILMQFNLLAQSPKGGVIVGGNIGSSMILSEVSPDFSTRVNEFNHQPGFIFEPELNKLIGNHLEVGTTFTLTFLNGKTDDPDFSAEGFHTAMKYDITEPVQYNTRMMGQKFYLGYYFRSFEKINRPYQIEPFIRAGGGYFYYLSDFSYQDPDLGVIFGKGVQDYATLTTAVFFGTAGIKTYISPNVFINSSITVNYVTYDFLDAVHNYDEFGERNDYRGIYADFKIGIFYQFTAKGVKSGRTGTPGAYLPFSK